MAVAPYVPTLTLEDYLELPLDGEGVEREIIRGRLVVSPRPMHFPHQILLMRIAESFRRYATKRGWREIQVALDVDLLLDAVNTYVSPDLMVFLPDVVPALLDLAARRRRIHVAVACPALVVEILSPGSEQRDLEDKRLEYEAVQIPHFWVLDPNRRVLHEHVLDPNRRVLHEHVLDPATGRYTLVTHTTGRVRPRVFAGDRPPFTLDLRRLFEIA